MRADKESKHLIEKIHLMTGHSHETIKDIFESLAIWITLDYLDVSKTNIPFLGELNLKYTGDEINRNTKKAIVQSELKLADFILRNIGQIEDNDEDCDIVNYFKEKIRESLIKKIEE